MANTVHPSAIVKPGARLGDGNEIGPGCVIDDGAMLGSRNRLWMNVYVGPGTAIGDQNQLHMGAVIGHVPQDSSFAGGESFTRIGDRNVIREYATIHRGTKPGTATVLGSDTVLMANVHLGHNCQVGDRAVLVNAATLAGHCEVGDGAVISGMVVVHQLTRIGRLAMISGLSAVNKDVPPYLLCGGRPAVIQGINAVGLRRAGLKPAIREEIRQAFKLLYRQGLNVSHALEAIEQVCRSPEVEELIRFVKSSKRGIAAGIGQASGEEEEAPAGESLLPRKSAQGAVMPSPSTGRR